MTNPILDHLLSRRSVAANNLGEPGPSETEIQQILTAAARVPDHKKLAPWRFILFQGEGRAVFGKVLAEACAKAEDAPGEGRLAFESQRFLRAPLVVAVVSHVVETPAVPEWEQVLSAGAVCQNMLTAATALGFGAQWLTEWYAFDETVRAALALAENERLAGFIYIGTKQAEPSERPRPLLEDIVTVYRGPA
ncbi:nitroreductase [Methyloligella sp. 2.7D]|uniref:nitroreductase family protein n=1 Tax=unclassified Methyloligella TaxID=2625955 RepID=UPI00157D69F8|nr:nitroreductase [Methyloligella sp. GL2]QKP77314.1 nitroreductase [Methyloligella sp. GL2]